jgi:hypothetical protein
LNFHKDFLEYYIHKKYYFHFALGVIAQVVYHKLLQLILDSREINQLCHYLTY